MKKIILSLIVLSSFVSVNLVYAAVGNSFNTNPVGNTFNTSPNPNAVQPPAPANPTSPTLQNPLKVGSIEEIILLVVDLAIYVGVAFAVLVLIFIGFGFVMAQGNPEKIKEAKMWLLYVIVGLAILISSKVIVEIIKTTLITAGVAKQEYFNKK